MKITKLNTNSTPDNASELVTRYMLADEKGETLKMFLSQFDFESVQDVEQAIRLLCRAITTDRYMTQTRLKDRNPLAYMIYKRFEKVVADVSKWERFPKSIADEVWHGGYARAVLDKKAASLWKAPKAPAAFEDVCRRMSVVYGFTDTELQKIRFFVEQVKSGAKIPVSLRRMLYLWSREKKTGKSTVASVLAVILNGETDYTKASHFASTLANELQVGNFKLPKISECNAVLLEECFFKDMSAMYPQFKRMMTSNGGTARLPYGQEFHWDGYPNYIATSNEPPVSFIKDWDDRRFLSIEMRKPRVSLSFEEITDLWLDFVRYSTPAARWEKWSDDIFELANETGEKTTFARDYETEMQKDVFLGYIMREPTPLSDSMTPANRITLTWIVDKIGQILGNNERLRRSEIEEAFVKVYGKRYSNTCYWKLTDLQAKARELQSNDGVVKPDPVNTLPVEDDLF